uniref:MI domain-containing protein n=1 Tax=Chromera velia CCMP2878 TaxID=1169474 RepID=A0A0G4FL55_9ALVE|mmetsp:Transcript_28977/g.56710  ORF Transcript_28977/g.56710 Transcript_28977/m.56710 type:complete len:518 (-) Transcript_28977:338-1891(-)|eukprot:Cvel_3440.t1-p1 / transcript=Cvel_3440.t1 / gene=Cvel_3440 / organism=Chromera_velia_CCMP2878 / gene_product=Programmed cell death protein 4, putative / transcript_product=Programmed cell death protein 4, putative / location=Cvel_scaffold138:85266-92393(+) / protein_length=517 / sequence_SO=supercontig / SO=protein_coding / is_pseudo=false
MPHDKLIGHKSNDIQDQLQAVNVLDEGDPLYDSEDDRAPDYVLEELDFSDGKTQARPPVSLSIYSCEHRATEVPGVELDAFAEKTKALLEDFLAEKETAEGVEERLKKMNCRLFHDFLVKHLIRISLDKSFDDQRKTSTLLTLLCDTKVIGKAQFARGLEGLIQRLQDVSIDVPDAANLLATFIFWAEDDSVLPAQFRERLPEAFLQALPEETAAKFSDQLQTLRGLKEGPMGTFASDVVGGSPEDAKATLAGAGDAARSFGHEFVRRLLLTAMERGDVERERASEMLNSLFGKEFTADDVQLAFARMIGSIDDIKLDCPRVAELLSKFLLRAIVDEILPPVFVNDLLRLHTGGATGVQVLRKVKNTIRSSGRCLYSRYRKVWTGTDETSESYMLFKRQVVATIGEFWDNRDAEVVASDLQEMEPSPAQAAEFVRKLMHFSMERSTKDEDSAFELMRWLYGEGELCREDIVGGFDNFFRHLHDISLDLPDARDKVMTFVDWAKEEGMLPRRYKPPSA